MTCLVLLHENVGLKQLRVAAMTMVPNNKWIRRACSVHATLRGNPIPHLHSSQDHF